MFFISTMYLLVIKTTEKIRVLPLYLLVSHRKGLLYKVPIGLDSVV